MNVDWCSDLEPKVELASICVVMSIRDPRYSPKFILRHTLYHPPTINPFLVSHERFSPVPRKSYDSRLDEGAQAGTISVTTSNPVVQETTPHTPNTFGSTDAVIGGRVCEE